MIMDACSFWYSGLTKRTKSKLQISENKLIRSTNKNVTLQLVLVLYSIYTKYRDTTKYRYRTFTSIAILRIYRVYAPEYVDEITCTTKVSSIEYRVSNQIQVSINIVGIRYRTSTNCNWLSPEIFLFSPVLQIWLSNCRLRGHPELSSFSRYIVRCRVNDRCKLLKMLIMMHCIFLRVR